MKIKPYLKLILIFFLLFMIFPREFIDSINIIIYYVFINENIIKDNIILAGTVVSLVLFAKKIFIDTSLLKSLKREYGKQKLLQSLRIINELLDVHPPEYIIKKINILSKIEVEMLKSVKEISDLLNENVSDNLNVEIKLSKKMIRSLNKEIRDLLVLIDTKMEIKEIEKSNNEKIQKLDKVVEISKRINDRRKPHIDKIRDNGKNNIIENFNKKD